MERMKELIRLLNDASEAYYNEEQEIMSNKEWDSYYDELVELEKLFGALPDSPTQRVGEKTAEMRPRIKHEKPALSLDKTKDVKGLKKWLGDKEGVLSWKMDGLTIVATYSDGRMIQAVTRGDGIEGDDVTDNAADFVGLPKNIPFKGKMVIRAEAVISYEEFNRIQDSLPEGEEPYKNPRNLAAGTVRRLHGKDERTVESYLFEVVDMDGGKPAYIKEQFDLAKELGFQVVDHYVVTSEFLEDAVCAMEASISHNSFPSDGLVLTFNDYQYGESLGLTGKYPRGSIAFKWQDEVYETTLTDIEWPPSRTGRLTPVAVFEPVIIDGTTVSRATLFNVTYAKNLALGIGDRITVYKSNKIIPQIDKNLTKSNTMEVPVKCSVCHEDTYIHSSYNNGRLIETLFCSNPQCPAKHLGRFQRYVCRDAMNIVGISDETLRKFIETGLLKRLPDIYRLKEHRKEIAEMEGFGEKSVDRLLASIESSKSVEPWRFLYAQNIPNVGRDASKKIIRYCGGTFGGFLDKLRFGKSLQGADDVGDVTDRSIFDWKNDKESMEDLMELFYIVTFKETDMASKALEGKTVVITGTLETFENRDAFIAFVEANSGKVSGSVSKNTAYLVNNDVFSESAKNKKAKSLGIPIVNEIEFKNIVLGN